MNDTQLTPQPVTDVDIAFGGNTDKLLPPYSSIPVEFKEDFHQWHRVASDWFFKGLDAAQFEPKQGIDEMQAWRHLQAIMASFAPKHEHKIAGVAWLMSLWFTKN